jgi:PTH1 family peptidyl-tRNA hydrolase
MNNSGSVMRYATLAKFSTEHIIVICDTLDLPSGSIRIKKGGSSAGHNGLKSLIAHLDDSNFTRIYIGIGRPKAEQTVVEYVLGKPESEVEQHKVQEGIDVATKAIVDFINMKPFEEVCRAYNRKVSP